MANSRGEKLSDFLARGGSGGRINFRNLFVLALVPEFQRDVQAIRTQFELPENGFDIATPDGLAGLDRWLAEHECIFIRVAGSVIPEDAGVSKFEKAVIALGEKYKLPYHYYNVYNIGVPGLIITDRIRSPERNWELHFDLQTQERKPRWIGIRAFLPLDTDEVKEATAQLNKELRNIFPHGRKARVETEDSLFAIKQLAERAEQPKMKKRYKDRSYLSFATKSATPKQIRELERQHPADIEITFSQITSRHWKKQADALRKRLERLNLLTIDLFGYPIQEDDKLKT